MNKTTLTFLLVPLAAWSSASAVEIWGSFQNGGRMTVAAEQSVQLADVKWSAGLAGYGQSSPVNWESLVYITTVEGENRDQYHLTAYQLADGEQVWQYSVANPSPRKNTTYLSRAAPTPAVDERGVVCFFEGGVVTALNHEGALRWERDLVADYGSLDARHGLAASVEQDDDSVFIWVERSEEPFVVSLNKQTGEQEWKAAGLGSTSWSSPRLVPVAGGKHLVLSAVGVLAGLDPDSGALLWQLDDISGNSTPTPLPLGDGRFLIGATVGRGESGGGRAAKSNGVVEIRPAEDGSWSADYLWRAKRATSSFGSPVVHAGVAYFVNRAGVLYGLDLGSGEELFAKRLQGSTWATPIAVGEQIFFFGRDGKVSVLAASDPKQTVTSWDALPASPKEAQEPAAERRSPMGSGPVLYAATWLGETVLLRRGDQLFAIGVTGKD